MIASLSCFSPQLSFQPVYSMAWVAITILVVSAPLCCALEFEMTKNSKCIVEEMSADVLVVGDFQLTRKDGLYVAGTVTVCCHTPQPEKISSEIYSFYSYMCI